MKNLQKNSDGIAHLLGIVILVMLFVIGGAGYLVYSRSHKESAKIAPTSTSTKENLVVNLSTEAVPTTASQVDSPKSPTPNPTPTSKPSSPAPAKPTPAKTPAVPVKNCTKSDYGPQAHSSGKNTMQLLQDNWYTSTKKFYEAVQFAGLSNAVNSDKTVVFAVNDYVWDNKLTAAQKAHLFSSPSNMKAMLNWHIVPSCFVFAGDAEITKANRTIQTLGGAVTYKPSSTGPGYMDSAQLAIWDFFSDNGAIHLLIDFVKPPTI